MAITLIGKSQVKAENLTGDNIADHSLEAKELAEGIYRPGFFRIGDTTGTNLTPYIRPVTKGYSILRRFIFPGSNTCGAPTDFSVVARCTTAPVSGYDHYIQWYNEEDGLVIAQVTIGDTVVSRKNTPTFNNVPTGIKNCAIRLYIPSSNNKTLEVHCWNIQF